MIVSDHIPEDEESKRLPFSQAATGAIGIETLLPLALEMHHNESLPLNKIIETLTINPAKILQINKGTLKKVRMEIFVSLILINLGWSKQKN